MIRRLAEVEEDRFSWPWTRCKAVATLKTSMYLHELRCVRRRKHEGDHVIEREGADDLRWTTMWLNGRIDA